MFTKDEVAAYIKDSHYSGSIFYHGTPCINVSELIENAKEIALKVAVS